MTGSAPEVRTKRLLDDLLLETLDKRNHVALLGLGHLELRQGRCRVTEKDAPVPLTNAHPSMAELYSPAAVVNRAARARAEKVDEELLLSLDTVIPAMRPESAELRIGLKPRQQIISYTCNRVAPTKALGKGLLLVAHPQSPQVWEQSETATAAIDGNLSVADSGVK